MEIRGPINTLSLPGPGPRTSAAQPQPAPYAPQQQQTAPPVGNTGAEQVHQGEVLDRRSSSDYAALLQQARTARIAANGGTESYPEAGTTARARKAVVAYRQQALLGDLGGGELVRVDGYA